MRFADSTRGRMFAKDPIVVRFAGCYRLYYSLPPFDDGRDGDGWAIGIAVSDDLEDWRKVGEILPEMPCEQRGICAPGALVIGDTLHLFYQTYGNGPKDAICHAASKDGVTFERNPENPIFSPTGAWNNGRAIDADVVNVNGRVWLYTATRDPHGKQQMLCAATASADSGFGRNVWRQECDAPILRPELDWEQDCIEAPALLFREGRFNMFYAGAYNNAPQQIGHAVSDDGVNWHRTRTVPFLPNGAPGTWNASESGHPGVFQDGETTHLFFQGNNDHGATWYLARVTVDWTKDGLPVLK